MSAATNGNGITSQGKHELANVILRDKELSPAARLVGLYIADHVNTRCGYAWPAQGTIATDLGIGARTVARAIGQLGHYFQITRRHRRVNEYQPVTGQNGRLTCQNGSLNLPNCTVLPAKMAHHPSNDPSNDPKDRDSHRKKEAGQPGKAATSKIFVEVDSPQWAAWSKVRRWPQHDFNIDGHYRRGWYFPGEWPAVNGASQS